MARGGRSIVRCEHVAALGHQLADRFRNARIFSLADEWVHGFLARPRLFATAYYL
jgi:hypothetical protein